MVAFIPLVALILSCIAIYAIEVRLQQADVLAAASERIREKCHELHTYILMAENHFRRHIVVADAISASDLATAERQLDSGLEQLTQLVTANPQQLRHVRRLRSIVDERRLLVTGITSLSPSTFSRERSISTLNSSQKYVKSMMDEVSVIHAQEDQRNAAYAQNNTYIRRRLHALVAIGLSIGVFGGLLTSFLFTVSLDRRLQGLETSARLLADGALLPLTPRTSGDTLSNLEKELHETGLLLQEREQKLRESNQNLNHLLTSLPGILVRVSTTGFRIQYVSPNVDRVLGYTPEEVLADLHFYERTIHPEDRDRVLVTLTRGMLEQSSLIQTERRIQHRDGHYIWIHSYVRPEYDLSGNMVSLLAYSTDITERRELEECLRENEARFRTSFDYAPIGMALLSPTAQWKQVNHALCQILGHSEDELLQLTSMDITHPEDLGREKDQIGKLVAGEISSFVLDKRYIHKRGHPVWVQKSVSLVRDAQGKPMYFIAQIQDITDRKRIELELAQARDSALESAQVKADFMANMSHEIRTPLNGIIGMIELLDLTDLSRQSRNYVHTLWESAEALLDIINDILDFSKMEAGKMSIESHDFDLDATVESAIALLAPKAHNKSLELASLVSRDVPTKLRGDAGRLRQVLLNLLGNAVKFTEQGEAMLRVTKESEDATHVVLNFAVRDSGIGIDDEVQHRLFHSFSQADGTTTRRYGGTGLGLAISKQIVELMGGEIGVRSKVGKGSTFWFRVRFEKQGSTEASTSRAHPACCWRVLVIDGHESHRVMVQQQLSSWNVRSDGCANASDALDMLHQEQRRADPYHLALINSQSLEGDELGLLKAIREQEPIKQTRLVMMILPEDDADVLQEAGADECLSKPVRQSQLFDCLQQVMDVNQGVGGNKTADTQLSAAPISKIGVLRILIAEDNPINQSVLLNHLHNLGHKTDMVGTGREAVEMWRNQAHDLILMDCHMPEMDGYEATQQIRSEESEEQHIPIIAITANALEDDRKRCLSVGMDDHVSKPFTRSDLAAALARWGTHKQARENSVVDVVRLQEMQAELGTNVLKQLTSAFIDTTLGAIEQLRQEQEPKHIHETAHRLKGSCSTMAAVQMADICARIEAIAASGQVSSIEEELDALEAAFERFQAHLLASTTY